MNPIQRLLQPLHHAVQVFFARDVMLRRGDAGVEIVLAERAPGGKPVHRPSRAELAQTKERSELALMQEQLAAVLDDLPETRAALRHLVFVEQALVRKGWRALHKLPLDVLQHALEQLEGVVVNWSPVGLANLRSKMAVAIIDREHMDPEGEADAYRTAMPIDVATDTAVAAVPAMPAEACAVVAPSEDDALAAAYAALGVGVETMAPTPAALAAQALAQVQASAAAAPAGEALEYHPELGSHSARAQPRDNLAGRGRLGPIKLRELQS